ncbi:MAG: hypothetical protein HYV63_26960 [Candidatus Schekmanbacteria bacterium]|nr:hypothetical protein [Candidatus Schekmanbacteria bacterium]
MMRHAITRLIAIARFSSTVIVHGADVAIRQAYLATVLLVGTSLAFFLLGMAGKLYLVTATGLGLWLLLEALPARDMREEQGAHRLFRGSLVYLPALSLALMLDAALGF